jgi:hypothetical protein
MQTYRCYFLDERERVSADESIEADAPTDPIDRALAMLCARPHHRAVEVWQGARRLYPLALQYASAGQQ